MDTSTPVPSRLSLNVIVCILATNHRIDLMTCLVATPRRMLLQPGEPHVFQATWRSSGVDLDLEADTKLPTPATLQRPIEVTTFNGALPVQEASWPDRQSQLSKLHH
jgi:hypothetical protein